MEPSTSSIPRDGVGFEALIADLSSRFVNLAPEELDREIEDALRRTCEPLGIDLAVLWQWSDAPDVLVPTHAWCAVEGLRPFEPMRQDQYPWATRQMRAGSPVVLSSLAELPAEAAVDRETCAQIGVKSNVSLPLSLGGEAPVGALGFNTLRAERDWPDALVKPAAARRAGLLQRARPQAPRPDPAGERGAPGPGGGRRRGGALDPRPRHRRLLGDGAGSGDFRVFVG